MSIYASISHWFGFESVKTFNKIRPVTVSWRGDVDVQSTLKVWQPQQTTPRADQISANPHLPFSPHWNHPHHFFPFAFALHLVTLCSSAQTRARAVTEDSRRQEKAADDTFTDDFRFGSWAVLIELLVRRADVIIHASNSNSAPLETVRKTNKPTTGRR